MANIEQNLSEEALIAFISESMDPFEADPPAAASNEVPEAEDDDDECWRYEYVSEEEVARENGCWIDDDGHWIPMEDDGYDW